MRISIYVDIDMHKKNHVELPWKSKVSPVFLHRDECRRLVLSRCPRMSKFQMIKNKENFYTPFFFVSWKLFECFTG